MPCLAKQTATATNTTATRTSNVTDLATAQERKLGFRQPRSRARLDDELAHVPSRAAIAGVSKQVAARFRSYTNARAAAKRRHANEAFEEMTYEERRQLCQMVFGGKTSDGKRMGCLDYLG